MHIVKGKADWIDVLSPGEDDLNWFKKKFAFKETVLNELGSLSNHPKVEAHDNYILLVHHFPIFDAATRSSRKSELNFLLTRHQVITTHHEKLEPLLSVESEKAESSLDLAHSIINSFLQFEDKQIGHLREGLSHISTKLFTGEEKELLRKILEVKKEVSDYLSIIKHQEPILDSLLLQGVDFWGPSARNRLTDLVQTNQKIISEIENYKDMLLDFERTLTQSIHLKASKTAKTFISLALITSPFLLLASISGILLSADPIVDILWYLVGFISLALIVMAIYLKKS